MLAVARSHGWSLDGINSTSSSRRGAAPARRRRTRMFHPAEVELGETITRRCSPRSSGSDPRGSSSTRSRSCGCSPASSLRYRRQVLALKQLLRRARLHGLSCSTTHLGDGRPQLQVTPSRTASSARAASGRATARSAGAARREAARRRVPQRLPRLHDRAGGLEVYPAPHRRRAPRPPSSASRCRAASPELDALLGGGLDRGTSTLLMGPAGSGKSSIAAQLRVRGRRRAASGRIFIFDESRGTLLARSAWGSGSSLGRHVETGRVTIQQVDPAELSPGEFGAPRSPRRDGARRASSSSTASTAT